LQEALRQADRRKDEFLAMLAHELRNPVAPILSVAEALERMLGPDERQQALVGIVRRQASHLSRLLDDLLDVARVTQGRIALKREAVLLSVCFDAARESIDPMIRARQQVLHVIHEQPLLIDADRVRIAQCICNLLSNASKFSAAEARIEVHTRREGDCAVLSVHDHGVGIPSDFLPHVFDLFAQGERGLDRSEGGLGIGLCVSKKLIELHGGQVEAVSAGLGRGATLTLRLPLHADDEGEGEAKRKAHVEAKRRVLVVDDNRDAADSLAVLLELEGHEVARAYSAEAGIQKATEFDPDIVLLDIGLPGIDGYEAARRLIAAGSRARLIAVSGYGEATDKQRAIAAGFYAHLSKPVDFSTLGTVMSAP
jgi:CheY-like chemotaxis protein